MAIIAPFLDTKAGRRAQQRAFRNAPGTIDNIARGLTSGTSTGIKSLDRRLTPPARASRGGGRVLVSSTGQSTGSGFGGGGGISAAQRAEAENAARAKELRSVINNKRARLNKLFDTLTEDVSALVGARRGELEDSFRRETRDAREGFQSKSEELDRVFAGRGLTDSSYRIEGQADAAQQFRRALNELGRQRQSSLAELGKSASEKQAAIRADRQSLATINLNELKDDVAGLTSARNKIQKMIIEARKQRGSLKTPGGFRKTLNKIRGPQGQAGALGKQLDALIASNTPKVVKDAIAEGLIGNFGGVDQGLWREYYQNKVQENTSPTAQEG